MDSCPGASYFRLKLNARKSGKLLQEKAFTSNTSCLYLDISNLRPFLRIALNGACNFIVAGDQMGFLYLFNLEENSFQLSYRFSSCVTAISFVDNCNETGVDLIVATAQYKTIHFLRLNSSGEAAEIAAFSEAHKSAINSISVSGDRAITCSAFDCASLWDLNRLTIVKQLVDEHIVKAMFWGDMFIAAGYKENKVFVFDSHSLEVKRAWENKALVSVSESGLLLKDFSRERFQVLTSCEAQEKALNAPKSLKQAQVLNDAQYIALKEGGELELSLPSVQFRSSQRFSSFVVSDYMLALITTSGALQVCDLRLSKKYHFEEDNLKEMVLSKTNELRILELAENLIVKYRRFPQKYRYFIWSKILDLPLNDKAFETIKLKGSQESQEMKVILDNVKTKYKVIDIHLLLGLLTTLKQLLHWDPSLVGSIDWLPLPVFPFVKLFPKNGLFRFEVIATLVANGFFYCDQEILKDVNTMLTSESPKLVEFYAKKGLSDNIYAKSLVESAFSDVFLREDWLLLWDNILSQGKQFVSCLVVAFNCVAKEAIVSLQKNEQVLRFFEDQNSVPVKSVVSKAYVILERQSRPSSSPRFKALTKSVY